MTVDEDRTTSTAHCLPSSPAHLNEHQTDECSLSIMTSQTVMEPLYATQPLNQQPQSTVSSTSTLPNHAADAAAGSQYHSTYPSSQLLLFATQPDTQFDHQLSLAEASQYDDDCDSSYQNNSQRSMTMDNDADAGNDQAFITQPMTQQFNIHEMRLTSPCIEGRICELQPVNDHIDANDEVMEQDIVQENVGEENTMNVLGSKQSQQPVTMNDNNDEHETNMAGDKSEEHYQPITTPAVPPPPPLALQSLANNGYTTIEISQTAQPPEKKHAVINPYAKKSPSDQISRSSSSNSSLSATNNDSSTGTSSTHNLHDKHRIQRHNAADAGNTVPRKPVYNPYAKSNTSVLGRKSVASPADCTMKAVTTPHSINLPANNATISNVGNAAKDDGVPSGTIRKPPPAAAPPPPQLPLPMQPSRRSGISISLPIYERLPSRNVSYQPAEILTVGELYRYLYQKQQHGNDDVDHHLQHHKMRQSLTADSTTESAAIRNSNSGCVESDPTLFNEITSVRITGTLLCVATTNPDERGDAAKDSLYGHGTFLLIGDPVETSRLLKREVMRSVTRDPSHAKSNAAGSATATPKGGLASILKSDNASDAVSSTAINTPSAQCVDASNSVSDQTEDTSTANPSEAKRANNGNDTTNNTVKSKPLHRGILNTQKKKLVYNGGGKRLSFGGKGLGANGRESGGSSSLLMGGRKFVTPKRIDSSANVTKRVGFSSVMKRAPFTSTRIPAAAGGGGGTSATNPKPEYVIQHHPSPMVPVWLGAYYNDDGLDGSVVGDLVMIMGEIVTEYCVNCKNNHSAIHCNESTNDAGNKETTAMGAECNNAGAGEDSRFQSHELPTVPTQLRGVLDAATTIAGIAERISSGHQSPSPTVTTMQSSFCSECPRFIRARFVKNANGTDIRLQREALLARRAYMQERKRQMNSLIPGGITSKGLFSVGCGPQL